MGARDPPEIGGPVGIPTVAGLLVRVYVSFAERGREKLFLSIGRGRMCSIDRFVALYDIAQYSAVQRIVLGLLLTQNSQDER